MNEKIAIVGAGLIGRAWAIVFARAGCAVRVFDADAQALAQCQRLLLENIGDLAGHGLITEAPATVLARITPVATLAEALEGAALVWLGVRQDRRLPQISGLLERIGKQNAQGEYYLTDVVTVANGAGLPVTAVEVEEDDVRGVNDREQLLAAERIYRQRQANL